MRVQPRLIAYKAIADKLGKTLCDNLEALSDDDLRILANDKELLTRTNCWWLVYSLRDVIDDIASSKLLLRKRERAAIPKDIEKEPESEDPGP